LVYVSQPTTSKMINVRNSYFHNCTSGQVLYVNSGNITVSKCRFENILNAFDVRTAVTYALLENSTIKDITYDAGACPISVDSSGGPVIIQNNKISACDVDKLIQFQGSNAKILNNTLVGTSRNYQQGIANNPYAATTDALVQGNKIKDLTGTGAVGLLLGGVSSGSIIDSIIAKNHIRNVNEHGILLTNTNGVTHCTFAFNTIRTIPLTAVAISEEAPSDYNLFIGNDHYGLGIEMVGTHSHKNLYWDYTTWTP